MTKYVYMYTDPSRNEPIYIGLGKNKRAWFHLRSKKIHPFIQRLQYMKKNGIDPVISFLCENVDHELACLVEMEAIAKYGRKDLGKGPLLNLTDGGEGGLKMVVSEETRKRQSAAIKSINANPEINARRSVALKNTCSLPEVKAQRSRIQKEVSNRQDVKERRYSKQKATNALESTIKSRREGQDRRWADPEARKLKSEQMKLVWAARRAASAK